MAIVTESTNTALSYPGEDYGTVLNSIAAFLQVQPHDNRLVLPDYFGSGYFFWMDLPQGMQVWLSDFSVHNDFFMVRRKSTEEFYNLRFDIIESKEDTQLLIENESVNMPRQGAYLILTSTQFDLAYKVQKGTHAKSVNLRFPKQLLSELMGTANLLQYCVHSKYAAHLLVPPAPEAFKLLAQIFDLCDADEPQKLQVLVPCLQLLQYFQEHVQIALPPPERTGKWLDEDDYNRMLSLEMLLTNLGTETPPTLEELAKRFHMSVSKLKYSFKAVYGMGIYQYYQKARLMKALELLQDGKTLTEVTTVLGFSDSSNFSRNFKKEFGISPGKVKQLSLDLLRVD